MDIRSDIDFLSDIEVDRICELTNRNVDYKTASKIATLGEEDYKKAKEFLDLGVDFNLIKGINLSKDYYNSAFMYKNQNETELGEFFLDSTYDVEVKKALKGKYQGVLENILLKDKIPYSIKNDLSQTELSKEDYLSSIEKLSKSTFRIAMNTPNQFLSGIDVKYTIKKDGKLPKLSTMELLYEQKDIEKFFKKNIAMILRALKYIDTDMINQMMDKRTEHFETYLLNLDKLNCENYELLSGLIKCKTPNNKELSAKEKIQVAQIVLIFQEGKIDKKILTQSLDKGVIDIKELKNSLFNRIIEKTGITETQAKEILPENKKLNKEFSYLLLMDKKDENFKKNLEKVVQQMRLMDKKTFDYVLNKYLNEWFLHKEELVKQKTDLVDYFKDFDNHTNEEIVDKIYGSIERFTSQQLDSTQNNKVLLQSVKHALLGDFDDFIEDENNEFGLSNIKTKNEFQKANLDFDNWLNPNLELNFSAMDKNFKLKTWDRDPKEDLFSGNKATCCSAIGVGTNEFAMPLYLTNKAFSVVNLYDENNNVVGFSRVFMAKVDNKPSLVMDNIELNSTFFKGAQNKDLEKIRDSIFDYMKKYSKKVANNDSKIYFCATDLHVPKVYNKIVKKLLDFIGRISQEDIYFNCADCQWIKPQDLSNKSVELMEI